MKSLESDLILDFLIQMALEIRPIEAAAGRAVESSKSAASTLIKYARALSYGRHVPIPVIKEIGELIDNHTSILDKATEFLNGKKPVPSLSEARAAAREAISHMESRLIVVIDDIDRLRSREIRAVMQLVKSVLDFPNTSFLLAFDSEQVARALTEDGDHKEGLRYLEKIIQLSINVPPLDRQLIFEDVKARFDQALKQTGHMLHPCEQELKSEAHRLVASLCDTPREVVRWANRLVWSLDALKGSVNAADLCAIEILRLNFTRELWDTIVQFCESSEIIVDYDNHHIVKKHSSTIDKEGMRKLFSSPREWDALRFLFPSLTTNYIDTEVISKRRLQNQTIWRHYNRHTTGTPQITGAEVDLLLEEPIKLKTKMEKLCQPENYSAAIDEISNITSYLNHTNIPKDPIIIETFSSFIQFAEENSHHSKGNLVLNYLQDLAADLLLMHFSHKEKDFLTHTFHILPILTSSLAAEKILKDSNNQQTTEISAISCYIKNLAIDRLDSALDENLSIKSKDLIWLIYSFSRLTSKTKASVKLEKLIQTDQQLLAVLEDVFDYHGLSAPPLIDLVIEPIQFIQRVEYLREPRLEKYLECLHRISSEQLEGMKKQLQPNQTTE